MKNQFDLNEYFTVERMQLALKEGTSLITYFAIHRKTKKVFKASVVVEDETLRQSTGLRGLGEPNNLPSGNIVAYRRDQILSDTLNELAASIPDEYYSFDDPEAKAAEKERAEAEKEEPDFAKILAKAFS